MLFEELDFQQTPLGEISLRRRADPRLDGKVIYEVKLGDEFLMSSLFTVAEVELARRVLSAIEVSPEQEGLDIIVGGLGLGYTAATVLEDPRVRSLGVIELIQAVIDWHKQGLVQLGDTLCKDDRCSLIQADFFQLAGSSDFYPKEPERKVDAVLLDIDHSPKHWLHDANQTFYSKAGLLSLANKLKSGGIFGLWSNDPVDKGFMAILNSVFQRAESHIIRFPNPYSGQESTNTVYIAS